jgi:cobalt-zinc-cadmium efflux system protein
VAVALAVTSLYFVAEVAGGLWTNSLALLSDAGHMVSDIAALGLSLFALRMSGRPVTARRTYGYHRFEILAALANGLALWLIVGVIFHAAYGRLSDPPQVHGPGMLAVASIGLLVNLGVGAILYGLAQTSLNIRGAFLHVMSDALGSLGAILAGIVMTVTGWVLADPLVSVFIGLLILYSSWELIRESVVILMQSVPEGIELEEVRAAMMEVAGVVKIHDLHVWAVTSGISTLSAHAVVHSEKSSEQVLDGIERILRERFRIEHTTIQLEIRDRTEKEFADF